MNIVSDSSSLSVLNKQLYSSFRLNNYFSSYTHRCTDVSFA